MKGVRKPVYGVGINDSNYVTNIRERKNGVYKLIWMCPFYQTWKHMLSRCYSKNRLKKFPTYKGCTVCKEWLLFSNFRKWMSSQSWEGKVLDKDILFPENKVYSPETCVFVDNKTNVFLTESNAKRGEYPIGVNFDKESGKFKSQCGQLAKGSRKTLGRFDTPEEAHEAWRKEKLRLAHILAEEQDDIRVAKALIRRYENYEK